MTADSQGIGLTSQRARNRLVNQLREMGVQSAEVLEAMRTVPRHLFVDEALASRAYENTALPIGYGQTISQPYTVARMTEAIVQGKPLDKVLEIGAGCGYQSAVLAHFARRVYSVERIAALVTRFRQRMEKLNHRNVLIKHGDGKRGWPEYAPFDAILVAAASVSVPSALLEQLRVGGRLVMPVGEPGHQRLMLVIRHEQEFNEECLERASFVPMLEGVA
jgi:protein-L-isoaspartate(D-aspartate) O-methyltransferase